MSGSKPTQSFLFLVHERKRNVSASQGSSSSAPSTKFYALLPENFKTEHPEVLKLFKNNAIVIISASDDSSLQFVGRDKFEIIEILVDVNPAGDICLTVEGANIKRFRKLLFSDPAINLNCHFAATEVYPAVDDSNISVMKRILYQKTDICCKYPPGETLLHLATRRGHDLLVGIILEKGKGANSKPNDGSTPSYAAVNGGHRAIVDLLLKNGADVASKTDDGTTLFEVAVEKGYADIVKILLRNGANVDSLTTCGLTPLLTAVDKGHQNIVEILVHNGANIESTTNNKATPLHVAVEYSNQGIVEFLLRNGANVNCRTDLSDGKYKNANPLHVAVEKGHLGIVEQLLKYGADFDTRNYDGSTPIALAAKSRSFEMVKIFVNLNARLDIENFDEATALDEAYRANYYGNHVEMFRLLLESCFCDAEIFTRTGAFRSFHLIGKWRCHRTVLHPLLHIFLQHVVKIIAANLYSLYKVSYLTPFLRSADIDLPLLRAECESEVAQMKKQAVGDTNVSFFDVLIGDVSLIARYLKNSSVRQILSSDDLFNMFPKYAGILKCQFDKGSQKRLESQEGVQAVHKVSPLFRKLPSEINEMILDHLSLRDLMNLKNVRAQNMKQ